MIINEPSKAEVEVVSDHMGIWWIESLM